MASDLPPGLSGWRRAACLGCDRRVVQARDGCVILVGTRNASYLLTWGESPSLGHATDRDHLPDESIFLLGVAHGECLGRARTRLEEGCVRLPDDLPVVSMDPDPDLLSAPYTLHLPAQPDRCPFCDAATELTREHVLPAWYLRDALISRAGFPGEGVARPTALIVPVCRNCNNTWMSVLENDTKPILTLMMTAATGRCSPIHLTSLDQDRLAAWAVKTAYLIDAHQQPSVPSGFLQEFSLQRRPNESTMVWIASYVPEIMDRFDKRTLDLPGAAGPTRNSPNGFLVTFTIGNVLFQVMGHFNGGQARVRDGRHQYAPALFRIWPAPGSDLRWPPMRYFGRASWDGLTESIGGVPTN